MSSSIKETVEGAFAGAWDLFRMLADGPFAEAVPGPLRPEPRSAPAPERPSRELCEATGIPAGWYCMRERGHAGDCVLQKEQSP